jgi:hypothetical protein
MTIRSASRPSIVAMLLVPLGKLARRVHEGSPRAVSGAASIGTGG